MLTHRCQFSVIQMVSVLSVSQSGYYAWVRLSQSPSTQALVRQDWDKKIEGL
jgi:hypothetical protein